MLGFLLFSQFRNINPDASIDHIIKTWLNDHCLSDPDDRTLREDESSFYFKSFLPLQNLQTCLNNSHHLPEEDCSSPVFSASNIPAPVSFTSLGAGKASAVQPLFPSPVFSLMWITLLNCLQNTVFSVLSLLSSEEYLCIPKWILLVVSQILPFPQHPWHSFLRC